MDEALRKKVLCCLCGETDPSLSYFKIPTDGRRSKWLELIGLSAFNATARLCCKHFANDAFHQCPDKIYLRKRLKRLSLPTLFLSQNNENENDSEIMENVYKNETYRFCYKCNTSKKAESWHRFPTNEEKQNVWLQSLELKRECSVRQLAEKRLCNIHFSRNEFIDNRRSNFRKRKLRLDAKPVPRAPSESFTSVFIPCDDEAMDSVTTDDVVEVTDSVIMDIPDASFCDNGSSVSLTDQSYPPYASFTHDLGYQTECDCVIIDTRSDYSINTDGQVTKNLVTSPSTTSSNNTVETDFSVTSTPKHMRLSNSVDDHSYVGLKQIEPRNVGNVCVPQISTPRRAKRCWSMAIRKIKFQEKKIRTLRDKLRISLKKVRTLRDTVFHLKERKLISETAMDELMVCFLKI